MEVSVALQARLFYASLLLGLALGVLDHLFRLFAAFLQMDTRCRTGRTLQSGRSHLGFFCLDLVFFAIASAAACAFFFLYGDGRPRGFALCGMLCAFLLYRKTVGRLLLTTARKSGRALLRLFFRVLRFCATPARLLIKRCKNAAKPIVSGIKAKYNKRKTAKTGKDKRSIAILQNGVRKGERNETDGKKDPARV